MRNALTCLFALIVSLAAARAQPPINAASALDKKFLDSIAAYVKLRKTATEGLPALKPGNSPAAVQALQAQMAERIRAARKAAQQGDICTPEIAARLKGLLLTAMQGPDADRIRKSLQNAEPTRLPVTVNGQFPDKLPIQSTPATLLLNLPRLPADIEYRLVGRTLVLRDSAANVIIDFIPDALPLKG